MPTTATSKLSEMGSGLELRSHEMFELKLARSRDIALRSRLKDVIDSEPFAYPNKPPGTQHIADRGYAEGQTSALVRGYLYGFAPELKGAVEKHIAWMESQPE